MGKYDYLAPPQAPHITAGTRSRASKAVSTGAMISARLPTWNATVGIPAETNDGVAAQTIVPHPATHDAIAAAQVSPAAVQARSMQRSAISNVQAALAAHGHDPGTTNGELDYSTRSALRSFQGSNGLPVTGTIDAATHAAVTSDVPRKGRGSVMPGGGAILHASPKGAPVVRISTTAPPMSPSQVPTAGTAHPVQAPPRMHGSIPAGPSAPPVSFRNSPGYNHGISPTHPTAGAGTSTFDKYNNGANPSGQAPPAQVHRTNWHGSGGGSSGKQSSTIGSMQSAGPTGGPPQGAGAVAGGTQSIVGFTGGSSAGGGAGTGSTADRTQGFRPGGSAGRKAQGGQASQQTHGGMTNMASKGGTKGWRSTGWRICLVLTATIAGAAASNISVNPQMDFRGENLVIDGTTVGPSSTLTIPAIGTIPQIAGGTASTAVPGTLFSPAQAGALDFKMSIANQGNAVQFTANNTNTSVSLAFAALLFGTEVEMDQGGGMTSGVAPAGSYNGG